MTYLNVVEVESAQVALSAAHPGICELITLPHTTFEGRVSHALRLGSRPASAVDAMYLTGGVHAREWGSCEILINLATDLCDAYSTGSGIQYGGKAFSAADVRVLLDNLNIIVFPCVNPDGRNYSQTVSGFWRKNRNPANSGGVASKIGVDINRNHDFLWNFSVAFAPGAINTYLASTNPADDTYHGPSAVSEPETKNINYLHDQFKRIRWYMDVHSYSEDLLTPWGDDEAQTADPNQNFRNHAFDGKRGLIGGPYAEYLPEADLQAVQRLSESFTRSLAEVRGVLYVAKPSFSLYPTSGTNSDWAYSRHFSDSSKSNALGFTLEWGTEFQPPWTEMERVILDVDAGLIAMGLEALGIRSFLVSNRDTFSSYEVETQSSYPASLYAMYDGFSPQALGLPGAKPTVTFVDQNGTVAGISGSVSQTTLTQPANLSAAQRVSFTIDVSISNPATFNAEQRDIFVRVGFAGRVDTARVHLLRQPNPYMIDGPTSWLSTDVRVFQLRPGQKVHASSSTTLQNPDSNANAPFAYIQGLLSELRASGNGPSPSFDSISTDAAASKLELSRTVGGTRVLNFAVAKVRYRAKSQDAADVRVFFRMFSAMNSDMSYDIRSTSNVQNYRRSPDGKTPLLGTNAFFSGAGNQIVSMPFFAVPRVNTATASMATQSDPWNTRTIKHAGATEAIEYFGCWLDFNQTEPQFPVAYPQGNDGPWSNRVSVLEHVRGLHQCLVAEVRFQPGATDPISTGATPASSDRLAQRNLAIVESDNPGDVDGHLVQHTLTVKPSTTAALEPKLSRTMTPIPMSDELVIRWNGLPPQTEASLYFPEFDADSIVAAAEARGTELGSITKVDEHTVACQVGEISYVPIPAAANPVAPGLITLLLPPTVSTGESYVVEVEQHSGIRYRSTKQPNPDGEREPGDTGDLSARRVLGAFRLVVQVTEGEPLRGRLVRNLAVLKFIQHGIPFADTWRPVFDRYVGQLSRQLSALGVDPETVPASADDPSAISHHPHKVTLCGKVCEVEFDCFGDPTGFILEDCGSCHRIRATEPAMAKLLVKACRQRLTLRVTLDEKTRNIIHLAIVHSCADHACVDCR